jgi:transcriptional regulator with PAS, ATPase and Fis domain
MKRHAWVNEFSAAVTVCNTQGKILEMNSQAVKVFENDGGDKLIGANVLDCHPDRARAKLQAIMDDRKTNVYTIEKAGVKKLVYQAPWYKDGEYAGIVELAIEIPFEIPHFVRD